MLRFVGDNFKNEILSNFKHIYIKSFLLVLLVGSILYLT